MGHLARCLRLARVLEGRVTFLTARMNPAARAYLMQEILRFPSRRRPAAIARPGSAAQVGPRVRRCAADLACRAGSADGARPGRLPGRGRGGEGLCALSCVDALPVRAGLDTGRTFRPRAFLGLPARARKRARLPAKRVLVSFGGEDHESTEREASRSTHQRKAVRP